MNPGAHAERAKAITIMAGYGNGWLRSCGYGRLAGFQKNRFFFWHRTLVDRVAVRFFFA